MSDLEIVAVVDPASEVKGHFRTIDDLLASRVDLDLVAILTPNFLHVPHARACLDAGLPTLCEKPLATRVADAEALVAELGERDRLEVAMHCAYRAEIVALPEVAGEGITEFEHWYCENWRGASEWYFDPRHSGGGDLLDVGVNQVDWLLRNIPGLWPTRCRLKQGSSAVEVEAEIELESGSCRGVVHLSWIADADRKETRLTLAGGDAVFLDHRAHTVMKNETPIAVTPTQEYVETLRHFLSANGTDRGYLAHHISVLRILRECYSLEGKDFLC